MKKRILSIVLSLVLIIGASPLVFADTVPTDAGAVLTEGQKSERKAFLETFNSQKKTLEALRGQEKKLVTDNNDLSKEIRTILQGKYKAKAEEVKGVGKEIKVLIEKAKLLNEKRIQLKQQGNKKNNYADIAAINESIKDIRADIASINNSHKKNKEVLKNLKASVQDKLDNEKGIRDQIENLREERKSCEDSIKIDIKNLNYDAAKKDLDNIINLKTKIVDLLTQRQKVLNDILNTLNSTK